MSQFRTDFLSGRRPLRGLRVLDLSRILAGPWASQIFRRPRRRGPQDRASLDAAMTQEAGGLPI